MLHAGLDLSRRKLDVCLLSGQGEHLDQLVVPPDVDSLRRLARRIDGVHGEPISAVVESMTGARLVHDTLEQAGWSVEIADAQKVKGLAPLACKTDKIDSMVLALLSQRDLVPAIWLPDPHTSCQVAADSSSSGSSCWVWVWSGAHVSMASSREDQAKLDVRSRAQVHWGRSMPPDEQRRLGERTSGCG
jgi:hypothetical protein